ncbi:hypothetical protein PENSUB_4386 [Penicillium subrubescens]|uniref:BHLH domain-containing protein n=2 Tax=Penicillium subrubescens TaxID=1316194 RepID=A0A1Q5UCL1_9EURO|nr:hypothetical protein PENSUB_4386 [Penicillium subrubescens]
MAFNRTALSNLSLEDERYLNQQLSPQSRPMELFPTTKASDPLPGNWSYDSAIDLFSLNPAEMDPVSFDFADSLTNADSKDLFMDSFGTPTAISGFSMPTAEDTVSLSSDLDSDDQSWSMSARPSIDMTSPTSTKPTTRASITSTSPTTSTSSTRWSSSPEIKPQQYNPPQTRTDKRRKTRSLSDESNTSSSSAQQPPSTSASIAQDPQGRNAAKRAAHNIIEKRYRTNMNAKFLALEKAISPAGVQKSSRAAGVGAGAGSLKKSEILSNALAYIERIQQENMAVQKELAMFKQGIVPGGMWRGSKHGRS